MIKKSLGVLAAFALALGGLAAPAAAAPVDTRIGTVVPTVAPPPFSPDGKTPTPKRAKNALPDKAMKGEAGLKLAPPAKAGGMSAFSCCNYSYAGARQDFPVTKPEGVYANVLVTNPYQNGSVSEDLHHVAEVAFQGGASGATDQIVEIGFRKHYSLGGPALFAFNWVHGVPGCYNGCGFVDNGAVAFNAGDSVAGVVGTSKRLGIQAFGGNVWVNYNNEWIGYFPGSEWTGASPSYTFTTANAVQLFGEIASDTGSVRCSDMGNGAHGNGGVTPAYFAATGLVNGPTVNLTSSGTTVTDSTRWSLAFLAGNKSFTYGGPGSNSAGGTPGTAGSC